MGKILLFYKYVPVEFPKRIVKWQKKICQDLGLTGRILISHEGINGTLGGEEVNTERYKAIMDAHPLFSDIDFKEGEGGANCFPKLKVKVRNEIVRLGVNPDELTPTQGGVHLKPEETHELISKNPEDLVILDTRNIPEWKIGTFKGAILPDIKYFRDLPEYIDKNIDKFKDKQVLMFCTGGVRCERATAYLKEKNIAKEVYQMEGGIHRYAEKYPEGFFRGKNYVFDNRIGVRINDDVLGNCEICNVSCDDYTNCINAKCNKHFICCQDCLQKYGNTCGAKCQELVATQKVHVRPKFNKVKAYSIKSA